MYIFFAQILPQISGEALDQAIELTRANIGNISLGVAFLGGALMFFSPCVFPIFLSFIASQFGFKGIEGLPAQAALSAAQAGETRRAVKATLSFFAGFFVIFLALGLSVTFFGQFFNRNRETLVFIAGVFLILFGLLILWQKGFNLLPARARDFLSKRYAGNFFSGLFATVGLSPCLGPILFGILFFSASTQNYFSTVLLIASFVLGVASPFIIISRFLEKTDWVNNVPFRALRYLSAFIFIALGAIYLLFGGADIIVRDVFNIWPYVYVLQSKVLATPFLPAILSILFLLSLIVVAVVYLYRRWYNSK